MSKKVKKKQIEHDSKILNYCLLGGIIVGFIIGTLISWFTENLFWMGCGPLVGVVLGILVSYLLPKFATRKSKKK